MRPCKMIDTSIVRVHQHGACIAGNSEQLMGQSRGEPEHIDQEDVLRRMFEEVRLFRLLPTRRACLPFCARVVGFRAEAAIEALSLPQNIVRRIGEPSRKSHPHNAPHGLR